MWRLHRLAPSVEAIRSTGYDGWLTIESFGFALGEISAAASIWRDIESSPGFCLSQESLAEQ